MSPSLRRLLRVPVDGGCCLAGVDGRGDVIVGTAGGEVLRVQATMGTSVVRSVGAPITGLAVDGDRVAGTDATGRWWIGGDGHNEAGGRHRFSGPVDVLLEGTDLWMVGTQREGRTAFHVRGGRGRLKVLVPEGVVVRPDGSGRLQLVGAAASTELLTCDAEAGEVFGTTPTSSGRLVRDRRHLVWLGPDEVVVHPWEGERWSAGVAGATAASVSADGQRVVLTVGEGGLVVLQAGGGRSTIDPGGTPRRVALSAKGDRVVVLGDDLSLWRWGR